MAEIAGLLEQFGLTEYEAKTLATLFKLSEAEAPEISRNAQVPKTRVYDVLEKLMGKKLVIEVNGRPKKYKVVAPNETFNQLIAAKREELSRLEQEAIELQNSLTIATETGIESGERVMKVKDKSDFLKILNHEIQKAQTEVVCFAKMDKKFGVLGESLKAAAKNNVNVKVLHHHAHEKQLLNDLAKNGVELKQAEHGLNAFVIDNKKVIMFLTDPDTERDEYHFTVWNSNPHMARMVKNHFDSHWQKQ